MSEWLISLGPSFGTLVAFFALFAVAALGVMVVAAAAGVMSSRNRARIAEAQARRAEAKARIAEARDPSTAERMAATPDHPSLRKGPRGLPDLPD